MTPTWGFAKNRGSWPVLQMQPPLPGEEDDQTQLNKSYAAADDAERGASDPSEWPSRPKIAVAKISTFSTSTASSVRSPALSPITSPIHEGITPTSSVPVLPLRFTDFALPPLPSPARPLVYHPRPIVQDLKPDSKDEKPSKARQHPECSRWDLFCLWFNTYRKFWTLVVLLNVAGITMTALDRFPYAENHLGAMVLGNLLCAILMRNELFLRFLYTISIYGLRWWAPRWLKITVTSILQHVGGIHSGCALSGTAWLIYKIVDIVRHIRVQQPTVVAAGIITATMVIVSVLSAVPWVRNKHHNIFERHHRFIGWLGLAATWVFVITGDIYDTNTQRWSADAHTLLSAQELWFAAFMTIFVLIPWCTLREVPVEVEVPSPKVAILRFNRGMQQGLLGRISRTSMLEYHAFGIISEGRKAPYHYMVCGVQGDFTKGLVSNPPRTVWTRELKFAGVGHASAMFNRGIRVCTGTGIGAALSTCIQSPNWFLIWIGSNQLETFGPTISRLITDNIEPERMILWDTKKRGGRPDTMGLIRDVWARWNAEVIFITSNMQGNDEMMRGCRAAGLPAFGTLWDF